MIDDDGVLRWSCCDRREDEVPRADWWNVKFSRGDPKLREGVRDPPKPPCPPTFHEHEKGAAGWPGWFQSVDGKVSKYEWRGNY